MADLSMIQEKAKKTRHICDSFYLCSASLVNHPCLFVAVQSRIKAFFFGGGGGAKNQQAQL